MTRVRGAGGAVACTNLSEAIVNISGFRERMPELRTMGVPEFEHSQPHWSASCGCPLGDSDSADLFGTLQERRTVGNGHDIR